MKEQKILFQRLKEIKDYWVNTSAESLNEKTDLIWSDNEEEYALLQSLISTEEKKEAYTKVVNELMKGLIHSMLVMFDGGDELTDEFNIDIVNANTKRSLKEGIALNEEFFEYLMDVEDED